MHKPKGHEDGQASVLLHINTARAKYDGEKKQREPVLGEKMACYQPTQTILYQLMWFTRNGCLPLNTSITRVSTFEHERSMEGKNCLLITLYLQFQKACTFLGWPPQITLEPSSTSLCIAWKFWYLISWLYQKLLVGFQNWRE